MFKHLLASLTLAAAALLISACGDSSTPAPASNSLKVGLLVTGSTADHGWNQLAADSLNAIAKDQNLEIVIRQNVKADSAADAIRQFDSKGFALVIAHGYEYLGSAKDVTDPDPKLNPNPVKLKIAVSGGDVDSKNFQSILYDLAPASYQLGIIAAKVSKTGKIGFIGGADIPTVSAMLRGYAAGAKSVNPNITVTGVYTDNWDNPAIAKTKAEALIAGGNDIVMQNVDSASSGVFEAVKEHNSAKQAGERLVETVYTFGANSDQNNNAVCPNYTLASAVIKMDAAFAKTIADVKANTFKPGIVREDLASGHALAVLNPKLTGTIISPDTQKLVEAAAQKFAAGDIKILAP